MEPIMRVEDDLKPHNIETIKKILKFYETSNRCCAIQATGTGKTYLILRLLEIFNDEKKKAIILAPNNLIIAQTKKKMKQFCLKNAEFFTYSKLSGMNENDLKTIDCDLIIADELHRTGAKEWGKRFEILIDIHSDAKVFGVTATPLRCFDGRDMADEYFDGNRACNISLGEALVREIIPVMPTYVSALYTFEEEYKNMQDKIDNSCNTDEEKIALTKELKAAKQQLEKANGVPEIIKKHITDYNGKYIIFCKDKKHLYAMKDTVVQWFRKTGYDGKIFEYPYYSNSKEVKKNFGKFENNTEDGLKLLFVVDKLNEGLHLDDIQGCILLRTTTSNIVYYQQIGRAIDAGSNQKRVILDLVSNFNNLKAFNLKEELKNMIIKRKNGCFAECSSDFDLEQFFVNDYIQECVEVFSSIDEQLQDSWWKTYSDYKEIIDSCGEIPHKQRGKFKGWCANIKRSYERNVLSEDKITALNDIDFDFNKNYISYDWEEYYKAVKEYGIHFGVNNISRNIIFKEYKIGEWIHRQRIDFQQKKLSVEKIKLLEDIGFKWNVRQEIFDKNLDSLIDYIKKNNCYPNRQDDKYLFNFVCSIRKLYKKGKLTEDKINKLKSINFVWDALDDLWMKNFRICKEYINLYGRFPTATEIYKDYNIGYWVNTQKKSIKEGKCTNERLYMLKEIGLDVEQYLKVS